MFYPSQTWKIFLSNHTTDLVSVNFFTVSTATFRIMYVLVILHHERREIVHFNATYHPTAEWTAQRIVEAFPFDTRFPLKYSTLAKLNHIPWLDIYG
jgi:putative transposase